MSSSTVSPAPDTVQEMFNTSIQVAGLTVAPLAVNGGDQPEAFIVTASARGLRLSFSPAEACALAAALHAVAIHVMETTTEGAAA